MEALYTFLYTLLSAKQTYRDAWRAARVGALMRRGRPMEKPKRKEVTMFTLKLVRFYSRYLLSSMTMVGFGLKMGN